MHPSWKPLVVGFATALALTGCSSSGTGRSAAGTRPSSAIDRIGTRVTVTGQLEGVGGPAGAPVQHWAGTIAVQGPVHVDVATDAHGRFHLRLPPGRYRVTGQSPQYGDGRYQCQARHSLLVVKGATVRLDVLCQMM
jgi:hypothetical protein